MINFFNKCCKSILINIIKSYQIFISPFIGFNCRFTPTCSNYAIEVFQKFGIFKGMWIAFKRILRCQPFGSSGYDSVPD